MPAGAYLTVSQLSTGLIVFWGNPCFRTAKSKKTIFCAFLFQCVALIA